MPLNDAVRKKTPMTTFYDVPADALIERVAAQLAEDSDVEAPDWLAFTKTGESRELPPEQDDFWEVRAASLLRKVAVDGPTGVGALRTAYGGSKQGSNRYRVRPDKKTEGSGKIIRTALQQLEDAGYIMTADGEGRKVTGEGRSLLDDTAGELLEDLDRPDLERYA
jgi:small subunit ribosomal protein S19e